MEISQNVCTVQQGCHYHRRKFRDRLCTAKLFAREGAKVVVAARCQAELDALVKEITQAGGHAVALAGDVKDEAYAHALVELATHRASPPARRSSRTAGFPLTALEYAPRPYGRLRPHSRSNFFHYQPGK